jgi:hypothetical protein
MMKIGALRLNAVVFDGIEVRTKARLDVNRATITKAPTCFNETDLSADRRCFLEGPEDSRYDPPL